MDPSRWRRTKEIFEAALDRAPGEVEAFLDEACGDDAALRESVDALLAADQEDGPAFEPLSRGASVAMASESLGESTGERQVGKYRLIKAMGSGGMGTVYEAIRVDGVYDQQVAVKLIRPGMATDDILRRFRQERQTLAGLDHPNVAKLLDGGATADGSPYLVLEFIDGKPIHQFCDERGLPVKDRLQLFRTVCLAVQAAHRNLVVHRDLKPGNILVTGDGTPKLLDFGISKILTGEGASQPETVTDLTQRYMTPQYASPEQIRGEPITTASDVYSLGVVLYELLTGRRPYDVSSESRQQAERLICEVDPARPSAAVGVVGEITRSHGTKQTITPESVSRTRDTTPDKLRRRLQGDLDTIVLTAMHKDPARRYASVEHLSDDVRRYLEGLPVLAQRDTLRYRAGKFIRRNKVVVMAALFMLLSLTAGVIGTSVGYVRTAAALEKAEAETERAKKEMENARVEARKAGRTKDFLQDMLGAADPYRENKDITVREVLDQTAERVQDELADEPEVRASVHHTIGATYTSLGEFEKAEHHLRTCLELRRSVFGERHLTVAFSINALAAMLLEKGQLVEAEALMRDALAMRQELGPENELDIAEVLNNLGRVLEDQGNINEAMDYYVRSLEVLDGLLGREDPQTIYTMHNLAGLYIARGDYGQAEPLCEEVLGLAKRVIGPEHPNTVNAANNLATLYVELGRFSEAEPLFTEVWSVYRRVLGEEHIRTLTAMNNLAVLYDNLGRYDEAGPLYEQVLDIRRRTLSEGHPSTITSMSDLGMFHYAAGRYEAALPLCEKALRSSESILGKEHPNTVERMGNLALLYSDLGRYAEAEPLFLSAIATGERVLGKEHPRTLETIGNLARLYRNVGRMAEAEVLYVRRYETTLQVLGKDHPATLTTMSNLAVLYLALERYDDAVPLCAQALETQRLTLGSEHPSTLITMNNLGRALANRGDLDEAVVLFREATDTGSRVLPDGHWFLGVFKGYYGDCLTKMKRLDDAEQQLTAALSTLRDALGDDHERTQLVAGFLADLYEASGEPAKAADYRPKPKSATGRPD